MLGSVATFPKRIHARFDPLKLITIMLCYANVYAELYKRVYLRKEQLNAIVERENFGVARLLFIARYIDFPSDKDREHYFAKKQGGKMIFR